MSAKITFFLSVCSLSLTFPGRSTLPVNDYYRLGNIVQMSNRNSNINPAGMTMGFSLWPSGGTSSVANYMQDLAATPAVRYLSAQQRGSYSGHITDNQLLLTGNFEEGVIYEVTVYNMIGAHVFTGTFTAYGNTVYFDMGRQINPGIYMIAISRKNDPASKEIIKIVKQ